MSWAFLAAWLGLIAARVLAFVCQFVWFKPNALLWSLFLCAPMVPLFDRFWPGTKATWNAADPQANDAARTRT